MKLPRGVRTAISGTFWVPTTASKTLVQLLDERDDLIRVGHLRWSEVQSFVPPAVEPTTEAAEASADIFPLLQDNLPEHHEPDGAQPPAD